LRRLLTPWRAVGAIALLALIALLVLYSVPSGTFPHQLVGRKAATSQYLLTPGGAHPVAPLVQVQGARPSKSGSLYFVDVLERRASTLDALLPSLHPHATLVPADAIVPPCSSDAQATAAALQDMAVSHRVAAVVALRKLHYHVVAKPTGVLVAQVILGTHAPCHLQERDVVVAVDGMPTPTETALHKALGRVQPGAVVELRVRRDGKLQTLSVRTVTSPVDPKRAIIGIRVAQAATIKLPRKVKIDLGSVGGPSAGLPFALDVYQELGANVDRGKRVVATGEIALDGSIAPIGGVKQKTFGARAAHADVFLVPAGENATEARRYAGNLRIIPVESFQQALSALRTLSTE
jgi:PDZ domain-containing protein